VFGVGPVGEALRQPDHVFLSADKVEQVASTQLVGHDDQVDRFRGVVIQIEKDLEKLLMSGEVEPGAVRAADDRNHLGNGFPAHHHRAEKGHLRIEVLRRDPIGTYRN